MKHLLLSFLLMSGFFVKAQTDTCAFPFQKYDVKSEALGESREFWVSLPLHYSDTNTYPVIYVLDAEWRFDLIRNLVYYMGADGDIPPSIVVGIPHVEVENKRGRDLTFSESLIEYDGETVNEDWYHAGNAGGAAAFYEHLTKEVMMEVKRRYPTNEHETLIGHSLGGYFGAYILTMRHPFEVIHAYDPSVWYSDGEVTKRLAKGVGKREPVKLFITWQPDPAFHAQKIEAFISEAKRIPLLEVSTKHYPNRTHNALFLDSFMTGIRMTNASEDERE